MQLQPHKAFTLVEILIVVIVLSILAAVVIPQISMGRDDALQAVFVNDLRTFSNAAYLFMGETGQVLPDSSTGQVPAGWDSYIDAHAWQAGPVIGGSWDTEAGDLGGLTSAIGVHFSGVGMTRDDAYMQGIDGLCDNGDLSTGHFRKLAAARYYSVLKP